MPQSQWKSFVSIPEHHCPIITSDGGGDFPDRTLRRSTPLLHPDYSYHFCIKELFHLVTERQRMNAGYPQGILDEVDTWIEYLRKICIFKLPQPETINTPQLFSVNDGNFASTIARREKISLPSRIDSPINDIPFMFLNDDTIKMAIGAVLHTVRDSAERDSFLSYLGMVLEINSIAYGEGTVAREKVDNGLYGLQRAFESFMKKHLLDEDIKEGFEIEIGDIVQARFGVDYEKTNNGWRGQVYGSARGTGGKLIVTSLDKADEQWYAVRMHNFFKVASAWPNEHSLVPAVTIMPQKKDRKKRFYELFQIGIEIEGEFFQDEHRMESVTSRYFDSNNGTIKNDGSLSRKRDGGNMLELNSPIIKTEEDEEEFLLAMKQISTVKKRASGPLDVFAWANETAGTHFHVDWNKKGIQKYIKEHGVDTGYRVGTSQYLRIFDSVEFEQYFFKRYFESFHLKKFWTRLSNNYCQSFLTPKKTEDGVDATSLTEVEQKKYERGKYAWLNLQCLSSNMGIEFRIFPYVTSVQGVKELISFVQSVMLEYLENEVPDDAFLLVRDYYHRERSGNRLNIELMSDEEKKLYLSMNILGRDKDLMSLNAMKTIDMFYKKYGPCDERVLFYKKPYSKSIIKRILGENGSHYEDVCIFGEEKKRTKSITGITQSEANLAYSFPATASTSYRLYSDVVDLF